MLTVMQWCAILAGKIEDQVRYSTIYEQRYRNDYILPFIAREYREVYGTEVDLLWPALNPPRTGIAAIGIDALVERLTVHGVTCDDAEAAKVINHAWEDNALDVMHREAHREAFIKARSFGAVSRTADGVHAIVGIESPDQMAVHRMTSPPYDVDASLKVQTDEWTGVRFGLLQLPGRHIRLVEGPEAVKDPEGSTTVSRWVVESEQPSGFLGVPVVEFAHKPRLLASAMSEIEPIASLVDIVDLVEGLMVFAGHFGAVPIRTVVGIDVPRDPADPSKPLLGADGKPAMGFNPRADHTWFATSPDAKFGQLQPADLSSFVTWAEHAAAGVRSATSVASTYYSQELKSHMSAELLKVDEAPMVRRILAMGKDGSFGQAWRRLDGLILEVEAPAKVGARVQPNWINPETRVDSQATDSFQKAVASGIGVRVAAEQYLGWDPEVIERGVAEAEAAAAAGAATGPIVAPAPVEMPKPMQVIKLAP